MGFRVSRAPLILLFAWTTAACERCAPGQVAQGVARLTMRNTGALADLINADDRCGFASSTVMNAAAITGEPGMPGSATWTVTDCALDLDAAPYATTDCNGAVTRMRGQVKISATKTIHGVLTGDSMQPVVPGASDAVTLELTSASFTNLTVEASDSDAILTMISGAISGRVKPLLAASADLGVCSIPTKNVAFEDVKYTNASVHVHNSDHDFDVPVPTSNLQAVNGKIGDKENWLTGSITVWGDGEGIPNDEDDTGLNPDYDAAKLAASYACTENLAQPVKFECGDVVGPKLAQGAARLTVRTFGTLGDRLDKDTSCGFSSRAVLDSAVAIGATGGQGSVTLSVENCTLDFAPDTVAHTSCTGGQRKVSGKITVSATKTLVGRLTGNADTPVVPMTDAPAVLEIRHAEFDNFEVDEDGTGMRWISGAIKGELHPRVAADTAKQGACGFETPIARFENIAYETPSKVRLKSSSGSFGTTIDASNLHALNGTWGMDSNQLGGTITLGADTYVLPVDPADPGLDPEFDQARFDAQWQCGSAELPPRFDCRFVDPLAQGAAQLGAMLTGALTKLLEHDTRCGFSSERVKSRAQITGATGDPGGTAVLSVTQPCELDFTMPETEVEHDCNGKRTLVHGRALVTGTKTLHGYVSGDPDEPIVPTTRDPAEISISATLDNFKVWTDPGKNALTVLSGGISATVRPRVAIDTVTGACSIVTPVAELSGINYQGASLRIESEGKIFDVAVSSSMLDGVNGEKDGVTNRLAGTLVMDGESFTIPVHGEPVLDPDFDPARFESSYACLPHLKVPAGDAQCNMVDVLANGAARLVILSLGTVSSMANADTSCGFSTQSVLTHPAEVVGDVGQPGMMSWNISNCYLSRSGNNPEQTDCLGRETYVSGGVNISGHRRVTGLRNEVRILIFIHFDSIIPDHRDAVELGLDQLRFDHFEVAQVEPGQSAPFRALLVRSGSMHASVHPILGEEASDPGKYDVPTPIAHLVDVHLENADARVSSDGKRFNVHIDSADLEAFNGSWSRANMTNLIRGTVVLNGHTVQVSPEMLDPSYTQQNFDARYQCTDNLAGLVPP